MESKCAGEDYNSKFDPMWYLSAFYSPDCYLLRDKSLLQKLYDAFSKMGEYVKDGRLLEFGCGPTVHTAFLASRVFKEITMAEYAKPNRDMVEKWLRKEEGGFDWSHFLNCVADMEQISPDAIAERTRRAIKEVVPCDVESETLLLDSSKAPYDFIMSTLTLEVGCRSIPSYRKAMFNLCRLIKPGGQLFLNGMFGETFYKVKDQKFCSLPVTQEDITGAVEASGLTVEYFDHTHLEGVEEYTDHKGFYNLLASKKA